MVIRDCYARRVSTSEASCRSLSEGMILLRSGEEVDRIRLAIGTSYVFNITNAIIELMFF